jgi:hypothetical protein
MLDFNGIDALNQRFPESPALGILRIVFFAADTFATSLGGVQPRHALEGCGFSSTFVQPGRRIAMFRDSYRASSLCSNAFYACWSRWTSQTRARSRGRFAHYVLSRRKPERDRLARISPCELHV